MTLCKSCHAKIHAEHGDRWGAVQMVQNLESMGFTVVPFGQGFKDMSPPTKELMKLTLEQKLAHGGHPVLLPTMKEEFYSYKNGALVFTPKAPLLFVYLNL